MQPGGSALPPRGGEELGHRVDRRVSSVPVDGSHAAQVAREVASVDEAREGELFEEAGAHVIEVLLAGKGVHQLGRNGYPSEPERRGHRLAGRADVDDPVVRESLQCADWSPVDRKSTRLNSSHVAISYA